MRLPRTIHSPARFTQSLGPWFDGAFDWSWALGTWPDGSRISPTDNDGVVERMGHILVMETKDIGSPVLVGQLRLLEAQWRLGVVTVFIIWGKQTPQEMTIWESMVFGGRRFKWSWPCSAQVAGKHLRAWWKRAEANPRPMDEWIRWRQPLYPTSWYENQGH